MFRYGVDIVLRYCAVMYQQNVARLWCTRDNSLSGRAVVEEIALESHLFVPRVEVSASEVKTLFVLRFEEVNRERLFDVATAHLAEWSVWYGVCRMWS